MEEMNEKVKAETSESSEKCEHVERVSMENAPEASSCTISCEPCGKVCSMAENSNGESDMLDFSHRRGGMNHQNGRAQTRKRGKPGRNTQKKTRSKQKLKTENVVIQGESAGKDQNRDKPVIALDKKLCFCLICATQFTSRDNFEEHQPCRRNIVCVKCDRRFKCPYELKRHMSRKFACKKRPEKATSRKLKLDCDVCGQQLQGRGALANHMRIHINERQFKCMKCDRTFMQAASLQAHITRVHEDVKPFLCARCGKSYCMESSLNYHLRSHFEEDSQEKYQDLLSETIGKQSTNSGKVEFQCSICDEVFNDVFEWLDNLRGHLREEEDITASQKSRILAVLKSQEEGFGIKKFQCQNCDSVFLSKQQLRSHMKDHMYKCQYCNRQYAARRSLTVHLQSHTKKFRHCCEMCGEGFATREKLRYHHFHVHDTVTEAQHWCSQCQTAFRTKGILQTHNRKEHGVQKEFICQVCLKTFATKYGCEVHVRIHEDIKPFHCPKCPRSFADYSNLIHHGTKVHPAEPKALFYRRKGFTTEKMDQEGANTVLSIDSSQLEILHELNNLDNDALEPLAPDENPVSTLPSIISIESLSSSSTPVPSQDSEISKQETLEFDGSMIGPAVEAGYLQFDQLSPLCCSDDVQDPQNLALGHPDLPLSTPPIPKDHMDVTGPENPTERKPQEQMPLDSNMDPSPLGSNLRFSTVPLKCLSINTEGPGNFVDADIMSEEMVTGDTYDQQGEGLLQIIKYDTQIYEDSSNVQNLSRGPAAISDSSSHVEHEQSAQDASTSW